MYIKHNIVNLDGKNQVYIYVELEDEVEFGEEFLKPGNGKSFFDKLKNYLTHEIAIEKDDTAVLIVNGVLIGAISLGIFTNVADEQIKLSNANSLKTQQETKIDYLDKTQKDNMKVLEIPKEELAKEEVEEVLPETKVEKVAAKSNVAAPKPTKAVKTTPAVTAGPTIKLNTGGNVVTMNLEDYVVGVVASEMPISFHNEALKAQAIVARTFAMKKTSQGVTLLNSTSHQTYKSEIQLKSMWGNSYATNISKIRNVVNSTKGMVLTYNGQYIDALYHSMSNSKTELPKYVWGSSLPYLQSVSSNWDTRVKGFESTKNVTYATLSSKLGQTINSSTEFKVLSETVSGRVEKIQIGTATYSGVKLRSLLGLRSTDFTITKGDASVSITTRGYGHGVGMSQSGANEAAKEGYTYDRILKHYYTGVSLVRK